MALIVSAASGNFNANATWVGGKVPTIGDEAQAANGHTITITANATCDEVSNAGTGIFTLNDGVTLTANVTSKSTTASRNCLQFTAASPVSATIIGNVKAGTVASSIGVVITSTGTLNITGNVDGGSASAASDSYGVNNSSTGTVNITGNCTGGIGLNNAWAVRNASTGTINITGNCVGGAAGAGAGVQGPGTINVTGNITGGSSGNGWGYAYNGTGTSNVITGNVTGGAGTSANGVNNSSTGTVTINGIVTGGTAASGANNNSTGNIIINGRVKGNAFGPGNTSGLSATVGASNVSTGIIQIEELEYGTNGMTPTSGTGIRLKKVSTNAAVFNYADTAGAKTLIDATQNAAMPAASDVRSGVSYASGALTGSAFIPSPSSVASGVPVDATTGTAVLTLANVQSALTAQGLTTARAGNLDKLDTTVSSRLSPSGTLATVTNLTNAPASVTPSDIWSHASRTITGGTVDTLTNAPTVPSASAIASQVRTELSVELARVDAAITTRATPANIPAADITAIKAKTDAINVDRINNTATLSQVGNLLAQANS